MKVENVQSMYIDIYEIRMEKDTRGLYIERISKMVLRLSVNQRASTKTTLNSSPAKLNYTAFSRCSIRKKI